MHTTDHLVHIEVDTSGYTPNLGVGTTSCPIMAKKKVRGGKGVVESWDLLSDFRTGPKAGQLDVNSLVVVTMGATKDNPSEGANKGHNYQFRHHKRGKGSSREKNRTGAWENL